MQYILTTHERIDRSKLGGAVAEAIVARAGQR